MRGNEFLDKMGLVDPKYVEAAEIAPIKKKNVWVRWGAVAACFCIIVGTAMLLHFVEVGKNTEHTDNNPVSDTQMSKPIGEIDAQIFDDGGTESDKGVYIPPVELPEYNENVQMDMIGLVVYNGGIYTEAGRYIDDAAYEIEHLVGEYLGYAVGNINEWSSQEAYEKEFASTVSGEVYEVKGYDTKFRICIRSEFFDENGNKSLHIQFLDRLNGITLENGEDLYEDRLHMRDRILDIHWQSHEDWNWNNGNLKNVSFDETIWDIFLDELYQGEFTNTYVYDKNNPSIGFYEDRPYSSIYDTPNQVHLHLTLDDGTIVELRLIEGGYVGLQSMGWYFVKIPGEAFDAIYDACGGTYIEEWIVAR